ncbi:thiolase-like protein [Linderina pennispora]|uniref:Thiolase-like protein n=1 Tax=Linderina pennispora TaxID=61395 RepID=A0A1Y1W7A4_9FUNG|nr:thiolase-like protein [Linderina pennispora]ORX69116.1 thiolase-like protein [Linderina pennispora]
MDDIPLSAVDILQIIDIQLNKSIKELVAGKSTLQNEIISSIIMEFGKVVPENITELPLQEAVKRIGSKKDSLGKHTQSVVQRLFASKLPNVFSLASARAHLKAKYGLGPQRQDAVLLVATTLEPVSRLPDAASGQAWLDSVANVYAKRLGHSFVTTCGKAVKASTKSAAQSANISLPCASWNYLPRTLVLIYVNGARATEDMESTISEQAMTLAHVYKDIGEEFVNRTRPLFSRKKARQYSSFWNWARQDAMRWIYSILAGGDQLDSEATSKRLHMLRNRSSPGLLKMLKGIISTLAYISDQPSQKALRLAVDIYDRCNEALDCDPLYRELSTPLRTPCASLLYMCERPGGLAWEYSESLSSIYFDALTEVASSGITFKGKVALVTGCGKNSIGSGLIEALLSGGAKVIATTSSYNMQSVRFFEETYRQFGARGSELVLVPFNQASVEDVKRLVDYIYSDSAIDSSSELTVRILLTNILRMLGEIKAAKVKYMHLITPTLVVLPHSPNQGLMGDDESWSGYISITGGDIGWTRSTSMTSGTVSTYAGMEKAGWRTFSREEMAFNITWLYFAQPWWSWHTNAPSLHSGIRVEISAEQSRLRAVLSGISSDIRAEQQVDIKSFRYKELTSPLANFTSDMPCAKSYEQLEHLRHLEGMVNLDKVVVVTGFGEVSSYGNAALRWEMEAYGEFSIEGCIELAWIMGLIKHFSGDHPATGEHYIGWVDTKTLEPVRDRDVKAIYEPYILEHTGIRVIEPELCENGAAAKKPFVRELQIDHDLEPFVTTAEEASQFKLENSDRVDIWANPDGTWSVKMLKGAVLLVAKAMKFDRTVVAQLPAGWDPERFGIPGDIIERVDPVALVRSGITDPYRIYEYLHVSEVGHSIGSLGVLKWRWMDKPVNNESLIESSINNIGPLKPVVAACATSLTIQSGKARMMLAGAANSYEQETSYDASRETEYGRFPGEICRPCTATRAGFTEGYGAGIAVLMSASAAIEMGAPVYGVVALSTTATDKSTTNLTAPGQGMLSARSPFLDINSDVCACVDNYPILKIWLWSPWVHLGRSQTKDILHTWGNEFYKNNPLISPLRGALAVWGLGPDDIGLASFHGTSTVLNDQNESDVYCKLMQKLGRTPGFPVPPALFMLNGVLQSMNSSIVPGNRNADNIDNDLAQYDYLVYPSQSYKVPIIKAAMLTSFGMSQSGAGALIIHPDYLFATLSRDELEAYRHTFVHVKTSPPYTPDQESQVYLDPHSRARYNPLSGSYQF